MKRFVASAPGKVILFGEHSVVYGKAAVAVSLDLRTRLSVTRTSTSSVELYVPDMNSKVQSWSLVELSSLGLSKNDARNPRELCIDDLSTLQDFVVCKKSNESLSESQTAITLLFLYSYISGASGPNSGFRLDVATDLPIGAGLGSSASFSVCLSAAILNLTGVLNTTHNGHPLDKGDLDLINRWAYMAEKIFHGRPSGIDNSICSYGGGLAYKNGNYESVQMPSDLKILAVNTKVSRSTKKIVADLREVYDKYPNILGSVFDAIDSISTKCVDTLSNMVENGITDDNIITLEDLIKLNHGLLRTLGTSHDKLEEIVSTAAKFSLSAKVTGAGVGGFAYVLLSPGTLSNTISDLRQRLDEKGFQSWEVGIGGNGVRLQTVDDS